MCLLFSKDMWAEHLKGQENWTSDLRQLKPVSATIELNFHLKLRKRFRKNEK